MIFHIAYACNEAYARQTMVSIASLCENHQLGDLIIYLIEDRMAAASLEAVQALVGKYHVTLHICPMKELLGQLALSSDGRHPKTIYAKIFLQKICTADKILYLDSDTVITAPLNSLLSMQMDDAYIAGVKMPYTAEQKAKTGLLPQTPYLCDGVLLIHLKKWCEDGIMEKCMAYIHGYNGNPPMLSEGTINYVSQGRVKILPPEYNLMSGMLLWNGEQLAALYRVKDYYAEDALAYARKQPVVIHYLKELYIRPWYKNSDHPYREIYWKYCRQAGVDKDSMQAGSIQMRTRILRVMNRYLPFGLFQKLYHAVKG